MTIRNLIIIFCAACIFMSCKSEVDKRIDQFENQVDEFESRVEKMDSSDINDLMLQADSLSISMLWLEAEELNDKQTQEVAALSLRLNSSVADVQKTLTDQLQRDLQTIQSAIDSMDLHLDTMEMLQ